MDDYASQISSTDATSDDAHRWKDLAGSAMLSPGEMESDGATERQGSDPLSKLKAIDTDVKGKEAGSGDKTEEDLVFDSPTTEEDMATPVR